MEKLTATGIIVEKKGQRLLDNVTLSLNCGELLGVIGPNGSGKSTLLRVLAGLEQPNVGSVKLDGIEITQLNAKVRARRIGYHAQNPQIHWPLPVSAVIALGRLPFTHSLDALTKDDESLITDAANKTSLVPFLDRNAHTLSGGELARVHIARLLAGSQDILLADEPLANLDPKFQLQILRVLREYGRDARGGVIVLHDLNFAARHCDRLLLLNKGHAHIQDVPTKVLTPAHVEAVFGVSRQYLRDTGIEEALTSQSTTSNGN